MLGAVGNAFYYQNQFNYNQYQRGNSSSALGDKASEEIDPSKGDKNNVEDIQKDGEGCETCKNRKYQDGSLDPGVSFKSPTQIDPSVAASKVRGHEMQHVVRNQQQAKQEGRKVLYQRVILHSGICPECGRSYVSGGTTKTVTAADNKEEYFDTEQKGKYIDCVA